MARSGINYFDVAKAAETVRQRRQEPTVDRVRAELGTGSRSTLGPLLKQWKESSRQPIEASGLPADLVEVVTSLHERVQQMANERIEKAQAEFQALERQLREELAQAKQQLNESIAHSQALAQDGESLRTHNKELESKLNDNRRLNDDLAAKLAVSEEKLRDAVENGRELKQEARAIREHFEHYQERTASDRQHERDQFDSVKASLEGHIDQVSGQLHAAEQRYNVLMDDRTRVSRLQEDSQALIQGLEQKLQQAQADNERLQLQLSFMAEETASLRKTNLDVTRRCDEFQAHYYKSEREAAVSAQQLFQVEQLLAGVRDQARSLFDENKILLHDKSTLEGQLKQLRESL